MVEILANSLIPALAGWIVLLSYLQ